MKKNIAMKWVKALRSGKYKQCRGVLHETDGGYCCLGVLCEVLGAKWTPHPAASYSRVRGSVKFGVLPNAYVRKAGMRTNEGIMDNGNLANMNDGGKNFKQIAKAIERDYEQL